LQDSAPTRENTPARDKWLLASGLVFIAGWVAVHVALFYLFFAGGMVMDILLRIARSILLPGTSVAGPGQPEIFGWGPFLQAGVILAGAAGIPAGLAFFWRRRRRALLWGFGFLFLAGLLLELYALFAIVLSVLPPTP